MGAILVPWILQVMLTLSNERMVMIARNMAVSIVPSVGVQECAFCCAEAWIVFGSLESLLLGGFGAGGAAPGSIDISLLGYRLDRRG